MSSYTTYYNVYAHKYCTVRYVYTDRGAGGER